MVLEYMHTPIGGLYLNDEVSALRGEKDEGIGDGDGLEIRKGREGRGEASRKETSTTILSRSHETRNIGSVDRRRSGWPKCGKNGSAVGVFPSFVGGFRGMEGDWGGMVLSRRDPSHIQNSGIGGSGGEGGRPRKEGRPIGGRGRGRAASSREYERMKSYGFYITAYIHPYIFKDISKHVCIADGR
jgi:hypothetical protein